MRNDLSGQSSFRSFKELNERNRQFWLEQEQLRNDRMLDETIRNLATNDLKSEQIRGVPLNRMKTLEVALADAATAKRQFRNELARKGGKSPKTDSLQLVINDIVRKNNKIKQNELLHELVRIARQGNSAIQKIDRHQGFKSDRDGLIHFIDDGGKTKDAPLSGLKDRLSRAKKLFALTS